jgi:hypothetical protein
MKRSEMINEISKAMANAQGEMEPALKSSKNPFFKSNYADLAAIMESIKVPLKKNDLSVWQDVITNDKGISVCTMVSHSSGQWIEFGPLEIVLAKRDAQSVGSAITYAKRYALSAAVGVVSDNDDDGEAAMGRNATKTMQYKVDTKMMQHKPVDHIEESLEMVENAPKIIVKSQWTELNQLIDQCSPPFQQKIWDRLASMGIQSFAEMDEETFVKMRDACLGNIAKQKNDTK